MQRARLLLIGGLCVGIWACNVTGPATGTVSGGVASSLGGGIGAATVVITPTGRLALPAVQTTAGGTYSVTSVPDGSGSVALSGLPANCTAPSPANYSGLTGGGSVTVNVTATCTAPVGTVSGSVTSSLGGGIAGVTITVTPAGGSALPAVQTNGFGTYTVTPVPDSSGSVALSSLPPNCTAPPPTNYSGLTVGGTVTVNAIVTCTEPVGPVGTVNGIVSSSGGNAGFTVTVRPAGGSALPTVVTDATGAYTVPNVPVGNGSGTVHVTGGTDGGVQCLSAAVAYNGLVGGGTVTVDIFARCRGDGDG